MKTLTMIGLWEGRGVDAEWPHPATLVLDHPPEDKRDLVAYLRSGVRIHEFLGYSHCRFEGGPPDEEMGNAELTDGSWVWPEGLHVYVDQFNVRLPDAFRAHAEANRYRVPDGLDAGELEVKLPRFGGHPTCERIGEPSVQTKEKKL